MPAWIETLGPVALAAVAFFGVVIAAKVLRGLASTVFLVAITALGVYLFVQTM